MPAFSPALTLVVVPVVYVWFDRFTLRSLRARCSRRAAGASPAAAARGGRSRRGLHLVELSGTCVGFGKLARVWDRMRSTLPLLAFLTVFGCAHRTSGTLSFPPTPWCGKSMPKTLDKYERPIDLTERDPLGLAASVKACLPFLQSDSSIPAVSNSFWRLTLNKKGELVDHCLAATSIDADHKFLACLSNRLMDVHKLSLLAEAAEQRLPEEFHVPVTVVMK